MLDQGTRTTILALHERGWSKRRIARTLRVSRDAVSRVIESGTATVPPLDRPEKAGSHHEEIVELISACSGNLIRVHEILVDRSVDISYPALTAYCRRHALGGKGPKPRAGRYHFDPGVEMQHDTSPHRVEIGGALHPAQCASLVFCYSRMTYFQYYPRFDRFHCKVFLADAAEYFGHLCQRCMIDNTSVVRLKGTGEAMVPVPEMAAFAQQYGFEFVAHEVGDANRSAHVERRFHHIENNFLVGRTFADWHDLNEQARVWCDTDNAKQRKSLHASPRELFARERVFLNPVPEWTPQIFDIFHRIVDIEGYVSLETHRYSVPLQIPVGRRLEVRKLKEHVDIYDGPRRVARHQRVLGKSDQRVTNPDHRPRRERREPKGHREKTAILDEMPELASYITELEKRRESTIRVLRRLLSLVRDYPRDPLLCAIREAERYGLFDLERVERMIISRLAGDFFRLSDDLPGDPDE